MAASATETTSFADGQQVLAPDLNGIAESVPIFSGEILEALLGIANAQVDDAPLTATASALDVTVGGAGQHVFVQGIFADYCPATPLAFSAGGAADRTDTIGIKYADVDVDPFTVDFMATDGTIAPGTGQHVARSVAWQVFSSDSAATTAGFVPWAHVIVRANASSIAQADVTILWQTIAQRLATVVGAGSGVGSLDGLTGALTLESTDNSILIANDGTTKVNLRVSQTTGILPVYDNASGAVVQGGHIVKGVASVSGAFNGKTNAISFAAGLGFTGATSFEVLFSVQNTNGYGKSWTMTASNVDGNSFDLTLALQQAGDAATFTVTWVAIGN